VGSDEETKRSPPDLRLEWIGEGGAPTREAPPLRGEAAETVTIVYQVRNVGGSDAFAAVLTARTALGVLGPDRRLQPGPRAAEATTRELTVALAVGMHELCLAARLQNLHLDDPDDPRPEDNRLCRRIEITEPSSPGRRDIMGLNSPEEVVGSPGIASVRSSSTVKAFVSFAMGQSSSSSRASSSCSSA
jgi:hypothetical protein